MIDVEVETLIGEPVGNPMILVSVFQGLFRSSQLKVGVSFGKVCDRILLIVTDLPKDVSNARAVVPPPVLLQMKYQTFEVPYASTKTGSTRHTRHLTQGREL